MTTNSFGGALPRFDYPSIQPIVRKASRINGLSIPVRLVSIAAAAGFGAYFPGKSLVCSAQHTNESMSSSSLLFYISGPQAPGSPTANIGQLAIVYV